MGRAKSRAAQVDAAWKRIIGMHRRFPFLPHSGPSLDWDILRAVAAEHRANLKHDDVERMRRDYALVESALGYVPPLPE